MDAALTVAAAPTLLECREILFKQHSVALIAVTEDTYHQREVYHNAEPPTVHHSVAVLY